MDIGSKNSYPAGALSNFKPRKFVFDDVQCASIEGVLQAFKFENINAQEITCGLVGFAAKKKGTYRNLHWKKNQTLWWRGVRYDRHGKEYQELLTRLYDEVARQDASFVAALKATGNANLTHSIGRSKESETVLTEREFISQLTRCRSLYAIQN